MKIFTHRERSPRGFTIIECLVYISVMAVILALGLEAFYRCWDDNKAITRNGNDIVRTLKAGEMWRADLRAATGPINITTTNSEQTLRIPTGKKELVYSFVDGEVRKRSDESSPWQVVLPKVKSSQMEMDKRDHVTAWRWEVELTSQRRDGKMRPLFSFEVVPGNSSTP
jgi:prepilin-type N-terminal cleavage/methylation domain-containing protein